MSYIIKGRTCDYEVVIGLEVHCQVISNAKLFSGASAASGGTPNDNVAFIDAGFPGMLPVVNKFCVEQAVKTGLGLNAVINKESVFARKHYFYADLPQGYQISQFDKPIVGNGSLEIELEDGSTKTIGIERLHLEQDAGKSIHDMLSGKSCIDLNRSGVALMEIVSKPDMSSPYEAGAYLTKLRSIVRYLETCDGNMNEGSMRCDANVSVRPAGSTELRTRCEIKNVNSIRYLMQAIEYEANRHVDAYDNGEEIYQETRLFNAHKKETRSMRGKENANDYRYFPDPDLAFPLIVSDELLEAVKSSMPEMPDEKSKRFMAEYKLSEDDAKRLVAEKSVAEYFEEAVREKGSDAKKAASLILVELAAIMGEKQVDNIRDLKTTASRLGRITALVEDGTIGLRIAKELLPMIEETDKEPEAIIDEKGLKQVSDTKEIEKIIDKIIADNPKNVEDYKAGKEKLFGFFVGQAMKATQGKANPGIINNILKEKLK